MYRVHPQAGTELARRSITFTSMADQDNKTNRNLVFDIILDAISHPMRQEIEKYRPSHLQTHVFFRPRVFLHVGGQIDKYRIVTPSCKLVASIGGMEVYVT
jgi:hypothetical protein